MTAKKAISERKASDVFLDLDVRFAECEALFSAIENALLDESEGSASTAMFLAGIGLRTASAGSGIADCAFIGQYDKWTTEFTPPKKKAAVGAAASV